MMDTYRYNDYVTKELAKRGAKTFGSLDRKEARLKRFIELERRVEAAERRLDQIRLEEHEKVLSRSRTRAFEIEQQHIYVWVVTTLVLYFTCLVGLTTYSFLSKTNF
jgi:hypothetical protein